MPSRICVAISVDCLLVFDPPARSQTVGATDGDLSHQPSQVERSTDDKPQVVDRFTAVDTSPLLGSPDPLPLETARLSRVPVPATGRSYLCRRRLESFVCLFVVEQRGVIYVFANRDDVEEKQVFLDIQDVVSRDGNEEGLLGLAFHPGYKTNGEFYVDYSTRPSISVVSRFRVSDDEINRADRGSEEVVMRIDQPYANHHGGSICFGPDGYRGH